MNDISIPKKLEPIVKAFFSESPEIAKALVLQAAKAIFGSGEETDEDEFNLFSKKKRIFTEQELEEVYSFMQSLKPRDMLEAILSAQIVISSLLAMRLLAKGHSSDQRIGLKMLQFSNGAIHQFQKNRSGNVQNITVNYNYRQPTSKQKIQTIIPKIEEENAY